VRTPQAPRVGYVLKRYPRFSETFILTEILAHQDAGLGLEIFSLRDPEDGPVQDEVARVTAPVEYLSVPPEGLKASELWQGLNQARAELPALWVGLEAACEADAREVHQAVRLARRVRQHGIGHLHAHFATSATTVARLAARLAGISYSFTAHAKDIFHEDVDPADLGSKLTDAAAVVTVSDFNREFLRIRYGSAAAGVRRLYNGLDLRLFRFATPAARRPLVVAVGRLVEKKGFSHLIDACRVLAQRGVDFECRIVGGGPLAEQLAAQIAGLGIEARVRLLGPRPQREVVALVQEAAVFAAPCVVGEDGNRDGLPTVLLEAMALGTPCVATDVTGIPEILADRGTGLMVPQRDASSLADALERLLADGVLRVGLARRARLRIEQDFDIRRNASALRALFAEAARVEPAREAC